MPIDKLLKDDVRAWSIMTQLVGAGMVARGLHSEEMRSALLNGVTEQVKQILEDTPMNS